MYYPGQPVFIPKEESIGIFIGEEEPISKTPPAAFSRNYTPKYCKYYVLLFTPGDDKRSKLVKYEMTFIKPLIKPNESTLTKQSIYYGPTRTPGKNNYLHRRPHWHSDMTADDLDKEADELTNFLEELASEDWVLDKYLIPNKNN